MSCQSKLVFSRQLLVARLPSRAACCTWRATPSEACLYPRRLRLRLARLLLLLTTVLTAAGLFAQTIEGEQGAPLTKRHQDFLAQVEWLITEDEESIFRSLTRDYHRDEFVKRFWQVRDPFPRTQRNELLEAIDKGYRIARDRYEDLSEDRARIMVLNGEPERTFRMSCELIRSLEVWHYRASSIVRGEFYAVFQRVGGRYQLWSPKEGLHPLLTFASARLEDRDIAAQIETGCARGSQLLEALSLSPDWDDLRENSEVFVPVNPEWAKSFVSRSTDLPEDASLLPGELTIEYPSGHQSRTVVQALLRIPEQPLTEWIAEQRDGNADVARFLVDGEIVRDDELFEQFRYRFDLPLEGQETLPLIVQRFLRPGEYQLVLKARELGSDRYLRRTETLSVPRVARNTQIHSDLAIDEDSALSLAEANNSALPDLEQASTEDSGGTRHRLVIKPPSEQLLTGRVRILAEAEGEGIARVSFALDGKTLMSKARAPYSLELDLGETPKLHSVTASALDPDGAVLAEDEIQLNAGPHRFSARLVEPQRGRTYKRSVRAAAEVQVPTLEKLDRVEFFLNDTLVATLFQPPFVQPMLIPEDSSLAYVRVVAHLEGGGSSEDVVFVNAPDVTDEIDVNMVELYATVLDRRGNFADGLSKEDFRVTEGGREQVIRRFEKVTELPIHSGILLDTSGSMDERMEDAEAAALHFFNLVLTERDRACLITFADEPRMEVPFTSNREILAGGLAGLVADGETALWDALVYSLYYFNGLKGRRALVVLSDGEDWESDYTFEEVMEFARRSGVALYTIGLDIDHRDMDVRSRLSRLATETGGRPFFIESAGELKRVYTKIEAELRSQYLIVYQSDADLTDKDFRSLTLKALPRGLRARTMRGYYP